jgi:hypothetical protein
MPPIAQHTPLRHNLSQPSTARSTHKGHFGETHSKPSLHSPSTQTINVVHSTAPRNGFWRVIETMWAVDVVANFLGLIGHVFHGLANSVGDLFN